MNTVIVKLNGGLGNQMFQYAFAQAIANKFGVKVVYDYSFFEEVKQTSAVAKRHYELEFFNLDCPQASEEELAQVTRPIRSNRFTSKLAKKLPMLYGVNYVREKKNYLFEKRLIKRPYMLYDGYFQHENYFRDIRDKLVKDFTLKDELDEKNKEILGEIKSTNSVSLHIRRGDYVSNKQASAIHGCCSLDYYSKAIEYIAQHIDNPHFYLFSDDIDWVISNLKIYYPFTVVDINQGYGHLDMELMKNCQHNIIANSSFSWWAAWLNNNQNKIVIAPNQWLAVKQKCDIVPAEWVKI